MLKMKQRETLKVAPNYLRDEILRRNMDSGTMEIARMFTEPAWLGMGWTERHDGEQDSV